MHDRACKARPWQSAALSLSARSHLGQIKIICYISALLNSYIGFTLNLSHNVLLSVESRQSIVILRLGTLKTEHYGSDTCLLGCIARRLLQH